MATTENFVFGDGGDTYSFSFPYLKTEDVRVELQEYDATQPAGDQIISRSSISAFTIPAGNPTQIIFNAIGADTVYQTAPDGDVKVTSTNGYPVRIRIYRATAPDATPATFFAGSAIRAQDLNDNFDQILYIMQEKENALISIQTGGIGDNVISTSAIQDDAVDANKLRDSVSVDGNRAVTTNHIRDNAVTTAKIATNAVTAAELADNSVDTAAIVDGNVTTDKIADLNVTTAKINDSAVTSAKIADGTIVNADVNASAAIAGTKVSPDFGSQNITTTGDVSAVDATISGTATISGLTYPTSDGSADQVLKTNGSGTLSFASATVYQGPTFRATLSAGAAAFFTRNTNTKVPYDTVTFDTDSCFNTTTNRFTPTKAGYYLVTASCALTFGAGGHPNTINHYIKVYKNGSTYALGNHNRYSTSTSEWFYGTQSCTTLVYMNGSTDYLEAYVYSSDINPATVENEGSFFDATWVHD